MRWWQRLRREEDGNVLYLTLIMILLLSAFTLVLVNVLYIGVMKVKAQNAADQLALSAGTLKARVLNRVMDDNAILFISRRFGTVNKMTPYVSYADLLLGAGAIVYASIHYGQLVDDFHDSIHADHWLNQIATDNGLGPDHTRFALFPVDYKHLLTSVSPDVRPILLAIPGPPPLAAEIPWLYSIVPNHDWFVQSRVEIETHAAIVGGARLGFELPDIVTRARAQIYNAGLSNVPEGLANYWRVRLAQPADDVDEYIKNHVGWSGSTSRATRSNRSRQRGTTTPSLPDYSPPDNVPSQIISQPSQPRKSTPPPPRSGGGGSRR